MSQGRLVIIAIFLVACIVALGHGFVLKKERKSNSKPCGEVGTKTSGSTTETPTPTSTPEGSPSIEGHYRYASIASDTGTCAQIGVNFMRRRQGSAVDAAIATILCQCVENTQSCGIGGGHFMTVYKKNEKKAYTIIAREMAPGAASEDMFVPENKSSKEGGLAIAVPGQIKGLHEAWKIGGTLPWKDLFQPAIRMLRGGWKVGQPLAHAISIRTTVLMRRDNLRLALTNPQTGRPYKENEKITMPKLADTFEIIANDPHAFYNGSLADDIVADIREAGGIITKEDLENYVAVHKDPLMMTLRDKSTIYTPPPPSSGAVYAMILNIADGYGFSPDSVSTTDKSTVTWHRIVEAMKFAYAKRSSLGDPDKESQCFKDNIESLVNNMTSSSFAEYVRSRISDTATHDIMYYEPTFFDQSNTGTSHLAVLAPNGDAVSLTSTINL